MRAERSHEVSRTRVTLREELSNRYKVLYSGLSNRSNSLIQGSHWVTTNCVHGLLSFFIWWSSSSCQILRLDLLDIEFCRALAHGFQYFV